MLTDFSPASWNAIQMGLEMTRDNDAKLSILHVYPLTSRFLDEKKQSELSPKLQEVRFRMNQLTEKVFDKLTDKIENVVLSGNVEETMLQFIREHDFDLVIIGINSNGCDNEVGSHTLSLLRKSNIPVMIVPNDPTADGAIAS